MKLTHCPICGEKARKDGKTSAGTQRWECCVCGAKFTCKQDNRTKQFKIFLKWLFGKKSQSEMEGGGRTFRRHTAQFWSIWALPPKIEESSDVVHVDGIYISKKLCVLIACDTKHVLGWYVCRYEHSKAWEALLKRIAEPKIVISDGGSGLKKALKNIWPNARHQRCVFHAFAQVKRYTTITPKTPAGQDLYRLARNIFRPKTRDDAINWILSFEGWARYYEKFLSEKTKDEYGRSRPTHERLVKARNSIIRLIKDNTLFTYIEAANDVDFQIPSTNNRIEGGVNAQLRALLQRHRGLSVDRRLKAVYWWCYMHSPRPLSLNEILDCMPTDASISMAYKKMYDRGKENTSIPKWGDGLVWSELHTSTSFTSDWD